MKLKIIKTMDGKFHVKKRFMFIWFDCTDEYEIDSLFAEGIAKTYDKESEAIAFINKGIKDELISKEFDMKWKRDNTMDSFYKPRTFNNKGEE